MSLLLAGLTLMAQQVFSQNQEGTAEAEVFELSPFLIEADSEDGYRATQTLSGTRMRTNLGDVGASVEVLTEEFLRDIGAMDMYDALDFVGNVTTFEKDGGTSEAENTVWFSSPFNARGFDSSTRMADFFVSGKAPTDFYNVTNFTVARGPNAVLYGIGSPGGVVNSSRKRPIFGSEKTTVQLRADDGGSFRTTLDANRVIVEGKLAARVALLHDDRKEFLDPAGHKRNAAYGTVTFKPSEMTSLTATAEEGSEDRVFRYSWINRDGTSQWLDADMPLYDGWSGNNQPMDVSMGSGLDREGKYPLQISGQQNIPVLNWQNMGRTENYEIEGHYSQGSIRSTAYNEDTAPWDYDERQLTGTSRHRKIDWTDYTVSLNQQLFAPELQMELAYNYFETNYLLSDVFGHTNLRVDANEFLPNGDPNPNVGVPYVESQRNQVTSESNQVETYRATLSYDLDLNDKEVFGMGLGRYNFMGLYEDYSSRSLFGSMQRVFLENNLPTFNATNVVGFQNLIRTRTYVDTDITPEGANVMPYYTDDFRIIDEPGLVSGWARHTSPRDIRDGRKSSVLAVQAYLWRAEKGYDRIILTGGYREDENSSVRKEYARTSRNAYEGAYWQGSPWEMDQSDKEAFWDGTYNYGTWGEASSDSVPTKTYSAVFKPMKDLSLVYNFSDVSISASSLFTDIYGNFVDGTIGETDDISVRWSMPNGKVSASLTFFETTAQNQRENNVRTVFTPNMDHIWDVVDPTREPFNERYVTLRSDASEGMEFSLVGNPLPGLNTRLSISQIETIINSRLPIVNQYLAEFMPLWEANRNLPLLSDVSNTNYSTVGDAIDEINREIGDLMALVGTAPRAQREWKVNFNSTYRFREGRLKGLSVGGGVRWSDNDVLGNAVGERNIVDPTRPFYGDDLLDVSANVAYSTKIWNTDVRWQLNVGNLFADEGTFPRNAIDDGTGSPHYMAYQVKEPRSFSLSATFDL